MYIVEVLIGKAWRPSSNTGLSGITFHTFAQAEQAMHEYGNSSIEYRVVYKEGITQVQTAQDKKVKPVLTLSQTTPELAFTLKQKGNTIQVIATDASGFETNVVDIESRFGDYGKLSLSRWSPESSRAEQYFSLDTDGRIYDYFGDKDRRS